MKNNHFLKTILIALLAVSVLAPFHNRPVFAGTTVHLRIEGTNATLFDGSITVTDCTVTDTGGIAHALTNVAACALVEAGVQKGFTYDFQDFGFGLFLKRIGSDDTPADFSKSWGFFVSYDPASVGIGTYTVNNGDDLLLAYSSFPGVPLRVITPATLTAGTEATILVEKRVGETDASFVWHGRWEAAAGASLIVGGTTETVPTNGTVLFTPPSATNVDTQATGTGFIRSTLTPLTVQAAVTPAPSPTVSPSPSPSLMPSPTPTPTPSVILTPTPSPSPTASISTDTRQTVATRALAYLKSKQQADGSIDGTIVTGWAAMAFGSHNERFTPDTLISYNPESTTDIERHILAIRAGGANPRRFGGRNLVDLIKSRFTNNQFGDAALVNDDIFGILSLMASGESVSSTEIHATIDTLLNKQGNDGAWENIDLTAAAIQALKEYEKRGGSHEISEATKKARTYLKLNQDNKGGFGENSATTSWAIQAIVALGEDPNQWFNITNKTPWNALLSYQNSSGAFGWKSDSDVSLFMTTYAVPALLSAPWPIDSLSITTSATGGQVLATSSPPTPSPSEVPRVAGINSTASSTIPFSLSTDSAIQTPLPPPASVLNTTPINTPSTLITPPSKFIPINQADHNFAFILFGLANVGLGVTITRLVSKLFGL